MRCVNICRISYASPVFMLSCVPNLDRWHDQRQNHYHTRKAPSTQSLERKVVIGSKKWKSWLHVQIIFYMTTTNTIGTNLLHLCCCRWKRNVHPVFPSSFAWRPAIFPCRTFSSWRNSYKSPSITQETSPIETSACLTYERIQLGGPFIFFDQDTQKS